MIWDVIFPGVILVSIGGRFLRRQIKGAVGEQSVSLTIKGMGLPIQNDVTIPGKRGLTQIDHLVLTRSGIVVLETKNYSGSLYDQGRRQGWIQRFPGGKQNRLHNPLDQNYGHIKSVEALVPGVPVTGFVVLAGSARFPQGAPEGVVTTRELKRTLKGLHLGEGVAPCKGPVPQRIQDAWVKLQQADYRDSASHREQMRQVTGGGMNYWLQTGAPWITGAGLALVLGGIFL
ncbi:nuclease-related domain-containing protein [Acidithiobacillus marinus]|nr:nuclease-related domain-containing protein [Acidithiobacillus marinus]